jgi:hypothetical protein
MSTWVQLLIVRGGIFHIGQQVRATSAAISSLQSISLACRSIFDDSKGGTTGKYFSLISDNDLFQVAEYWTSKSKRQIESAAEALFFIRHVFKACSKQKKDLLNVPFGDLKSLAFRRREGYCSSHLR